MSQHQAGSVDATGQEPALLCLIVTGEETLARICLEAARQAGLRAQAVSTLAAAQHACERDLPDVFVLHWAPEAPAVRTWIERLQQEAPDAVLVLLGGGTSADSPDTLPRGPRVEWVRWPEERGELSARLHRLAEGLRLDRENRLLREQVRTRPGFGELIGSSPRMLQLYRTIEKLSRRDCPVLIVGESGTGKELVARAIHFRSRRAAGPFVPVDCAGVVPTLFEAELFGYVRGAFTGAVQNKKGLLEAASTGTVFLDEIGELPAELQAKLLRALQEREIRPVGATTAVRIDVRVLAATNRDLEEEVRQGRFRQDLFYRLNVVTLRLPPLRDRKSDIPLLVQHFIEKYAPADRPLPVVAEEAWARLLAHDWPGNVRELENAIARALALNSGPVLHVSDLPSNVQPASARTPRLDDGVIPLAELERRAILRALAHTGGDKVAAARLLGIGKTTLYRKLKQYAREGRL
jgi:two-component system response regulator HydG